MNSTEYAALADPTFEQLTEYVNEMLNIDTTNLDREQAKTSRIFVDLYRLLQVESRRLRDIMGLHDKVVHDRKRYYSGKATGAEYRAEPLNVTVLKTEMDQYLNIDEKIRTVKGAVADADMRVKFVEDSIKVAKGRTYDIRNMLQWKQLTQS